MERSGGTEDNSHYRKVEVGEKRQYFMRHINNAPPASSIYF